MAVSCPLLAVLTFTLGSPLSIPSLPPPKKIIIFEESYNETSGGLVAAIKLNEHFLEPNGNGCERFNESD